MRNANKSQNIPNSAMVMGNGKVIGNPYPRLNHHQTLCCLPFSSVNGSKKTGFGVFEVTLSRLCG